MFPYAMMFVTATQESLECQANMFRFSIIFYRWREWLEQEACVYD